MSTPALAGLTTLRVGGPATEYVEAADEASLVEAVASADADGQPVLVLGGGSNVLVADSGFAGRVVTCRTAGVVVEDDGCGGAIVRVAAGEDWDALCARAVESGWVGIEALSGIPGRVGATPMQNVGAYGQEVSQTIARVRTWDRLERRQASFAAADCDFGYRNSRFKAEPGRYLVLEVTFQFPRGDLGAPVQYAELARALDVALGERAPAADVRRTVLELRRAKGMVLDEGDHDTWSAGSFFTNPLVAPERVPEGAPSWPQPDGRVKTSAAWLIEHSGFPKGYGNDRASLSTKHTLALTNRGRAGAGDLVGLAREIRAGVRRAYDIELVNEPILVGCSL